MAKNDLGDQLAVQQQINKVLAQRQALMAKSTQVLGAQVKMAAELCKALECKGLDGMNDRLKEINDSLNEVADTAEEAAEKTEGLADAAGKASAKVGDNSKSLMKLGAGIGLLKGVQAGFSGIMSTLSGLGKGLVSVVGSVFKLGKTLLSVPIKIWSGLIGMAQGGGGGPNPIKVALEEVRKEMGSLNSGEGKVFKEGLKTMRAESKSLGGSGLRLSKIFGKGPGGFAEAIKYNLETAKALGSAFTALRGEFAKSAGALAVYRKGLGFSAEEMGALGKRALAQGKSMTELSRETASYAIQMGKDFGMNSKVISKDMGKMMADFDNFGTLGPKVMSQVAVYTRKLGIEVKELTGLVDKFDNFEDAAKGAAQLAQSFGMNVDAMKMMKEQDPAARLSMLQKAFKATGKSVESMSRQELKMLSTQAGMSAEATKLAFSQKGLSMSYDDVQKAGSKNEKKQLSQAEAMSKLADSIERVFGGGGGSKFKGFFDAFAKGFGKGIKRSKVFRQVMRNIRKSLRVVYKAGKQVGKAFVKFFPGVKKMLKGLRDLFNPKDVKNLMKGVVAEFKNFFKTVQDDPQAGVATLIEKLKEKFKEFFGKKGKAASDVAEGGKTFLKVLGGIFKGLLMIVIPLITKGIKKLTEIIKNPPGIPGALSEMFKGLWAAVSDLFGVLFTKLLPPLLAALKGLFLAIYEKMKPFLAKYWPVLVGALLAKGLVVAILSMLKGGAVAGAFGLLFKGLAKMMGKEVSKKKKEKEAERSGRVMVAPLRGAIKGLKKIGGGDIAKAAGKLMLLTFLFLPAFISFVTTLVGGMAGPIAAMGNPLKFVLAAIGISKIIFAFQSVFHAAKTTSSKDIMMATLKLVLLAGAFLVGGVAFVGALGLISGMASGLDWVGIALMMVGLGTAMIAVSFVIMATRLVTAKEVAKSALVVAAASLVVAAMIPFSIAMKMAAPILNGIGVGEALNAGLTMMGLAVAVLGVAAIAWAAKLLKPAMIKPAAMGLITAIPLVILIGLFGAIIYGMATASGFMDLDWEKLGGAFKSIAFIFGSLLIVAISAALMNPATMVMGMIGLVMATLFVVVFAKLFLPQLRKFANSKIDFVKTAVNMIKLVPIMVGLLVMAAMMIPLGAIAFVASFFTLGAALFVKTIVKSGLIKNLGVMAGKADKLTNSKKAFEAISVAMDALKDIAFTALALMIFKLPFFPSFKQLAGTISQFIDALTKKDGVTDKIGTMIGAIKNPKDAKNAASAIVMAVDAIKDLAKIAVKLGKMELEAVDEGHTSGILDKVKGLMDVIIKGVAGPEGVMAQMIKLVALTPPGGEEQTKAVASVLSAIGGLFGGMLGPMAEVFEMALKYTDEGMLSNDVDTAKLDAVMTTMKTFIQDLMATIQNQLTPMITTLLTIEVKGDPRDVESKLKIMAGAIDIMTKITSSMADQAGTLSELHTAANKAKGTFQSNDSLGKTMNTMTSMMNSMFSMLRRHVPQMIMGILGVLNLPALKEDPKKLKPKLEAIGVAMKAMVDTMEMVKGVSDLAEKTDIKIIVKKGRVIIKETGPLQTGMRLIPKIGKSIQKAITAILAINVPDPGMAVKKINVISKGLKVVTEFMKAIGSILGITSKKPKSNIFGNLFKGGLFGGKSEKPPSKPKMTEAEKRIKELTDSIDAIVGALTRKGGGIEKAIGAIVKIAQGQAFSDPETMKMKMETIIKAIQVVSKFMNSMGSAMKIGGGRSPSEITRDVNALFGPGGVAATIIMRVVGGANGELWGLPDIIKSVKKSAEGIKDPASLEKRMNIVVAAMGAVSKFANMLGSFMKLAGPNVKNPGELREAIQKMFGAKGPIYQIIKRISGDEDGTIGLPHLIGKIQAVAEKVPAGKSGIAKKVKLLNEMLGAVATFASVIKDMMGLMPKGKITKDDADNFFGNFGILETMLEGFMGKNALNGYGLPQVASDLVGLFEKGGDLNKIHKYSKQISSLGKVFDAIGKFTTALTNIKGLGTKGAKGGQAASANESMKTLAKVFDTSSGKEGGFAKLVKAIGKFSEDILKPNIKGLRKAAARFPYLVKAMKGAADVAAFGSEGGYGKRKAKLSSTDVDAIVLSLQKINKGKLVHNINEALGKGKGMDKSTVTNAANLRRVLVQLDAALKLKYLKDTVQVTRIKNNIATVGGMLDGKVAGVTATFKAGKLEVSHNLKKATVEITVNLNKKELAKQLVGVKFDGSKQIATTGGTQ
tara:strand:- start:7279 stop:13920 length:6642 start_codon:yes stop_codon:yes gene_type:complete